MIENLKALTGMRFVAAFAIVWLHSALYFDWARYGQDIPLRRGVDFFFVLSGFILAHVYSRRDVPYSVFMRSRVARLWPLHVATLLCVLAFVPTGSQSFDGLGIFDKWTALWVNAALLQSWIPTTSYMFSWNSVSWSISTEMFFYGMFPLLLIIGKRSIILVLVAGVIPLLAVAWFVSAFRIPTADGGVFDVTIVPLMYAFPPTRLIQFCVGIVVYFLWCRFRGMMPASFLGCTAMELGAVSLLPFWWAYRGYLAPLAFDDAVLTQWALTHSGCFAFAAMIFIMASSKGILAHTLSSRLAIWLGEISFAVYLTHQVLMKVISLTHPAFGNPVFVMAAVITAGAIGHHLVELPMQRLIVGRKNAPTISPASPNRQRTSAAPDGRDADPA